MVGSIKSNPGPLENGRAKKYKTSRNIIRQIRLRNGYKSYTAIKHPNRSDKGSLTAKKPGAIAVGSAVNEI